MAKIVIAPILHKGKILCIRRSQQSNRSGDWETAAGHIDDGETPLEAMVREVREETGLEVAPYPKQLKIKLKDQDGVAIMILCRPVRGKIKLHPPEHDQHRWVKVDSLDGVQPSPPDFAENIKKVIKMNNVTSKVAFRIVNQDDEDLKPDSILSGDDINLFFSEEAGDDDYLNPVKGRVLETDHKYIKVKTKDGFKNVDWSKKSDWEIIRVRRKGNTTTYQKVQSGDKDKLALLMDNSVPSWESGWNLACEEAPDYNNFSAKQYPNRFDTLDYGTEENPVYRTALDAIRENSLDDDVHVTDGVGGKVLLLIDNSATKKKVKSLLTKYGLKVKDAKKEDVSEYSPDDEGIYSTALTAAFMPAVAQPPGAPKPPGVDPKVTVTVKQAPTPGVTTTPTPGGTQFTGPADKVMDAMGTVASSEKPLRSKPDYCEKDCGGLTEGILAAKVKREGPHSYYSWDDLAKEAQKIAQNRYKQLMGLLKEIKK